MSLHRTQRSPQIAAIAQQIHDGKWRRMSPTEYRREGVVLRVQPSRGGDYATLDGLSLGRVDSDALVLAVQVHNASYRTDAMASVFRKLGV